MSEIITARDAVTVAAEIKTIVQQTRVILLTAAVEIGRRLVEAKEMVPRGEWGDYLKELDFGKSTANNYMKLYEEYGNDQSKLFGGNLQAFGDLSYTQALLLLNVPAEERETFAEENNVAEMSTRELDEAVREYKDKLEKAETEKASLQGQLDAAKESIQRQSQAAMDQVNEVGKARKAKADAEAEAARLRREIEAEKVKTKEALRQAEAAQRRAQEAEAEAAKEEAKKAGQAAAEARAAEAKVQELEAKLEAAQKAARMADPVMTEFKLCFGEMQEKFQRLIALRNGAEPEKKDMLTRAMKAFLEKAGGEVG